MAELMIDARDVTRNFTISRGMFRGKQQLKAVNGVDLTVERGEVLALVGESGCGKTTLAKMLLGLLPQTSGTVELCSRPINDVPRLELARTIQPIFQDPYSSLNPRKTIGSIIALPMKVQGIADQDSMRRRAEALDGRGDGHVQRRLALEAAAVWRGACLQQPPRHVRVTLANGVVQESHAQPVRLAQVEAVQLGRADHRDRRGVARGARLPQRGRRALAADLGEGEGRQWPARAAAAPLRPRQPRSAGPPPCPARPLQQPHGAGPGGFTRTAASHAPCWSRGRPSCSALSAGAAQRGQAPSLVLPRSQGGGGTV